MTPVRLEPAALRSQVEHSTTEPMHSLLCFVVFLLPREHRGHIAFDADLIDVGISVGVEVSMMLNHVSRTS